MQKLFKFHKQFNTVQSRVQKYSEFIMYFMYNNLWQMQSIISQNNHPFFSMHIVWQCNAQAFWFHLPKKKKRKTFSVVIEATYALCL